MKSRFDISIIETDPERRKHILPVLDAALEAVDPAASVRQTMRVVDDQLLVVGSQNFHYSAWGSPSLTEYNLATDDPEAVEEFLTEYEYWWAQAIPVEEVLGQNLVALDQ